MTLAELITDLKAAGANDNTLRLAMNCYALGTAEEREACAKVCEEDGWATGFSCADAIRARGNP